MDASSFSRFTTRFFPEAISLLKFHFPCSIEMADNKSKIAVINRNAGQVRNSSYFSYTALVVKNLLIFKSEGEIVVKQYYTYKYIYPKC